MNLEEILRNVSHHHCSRCAIPPQFHRTLENQPFDSCDSCYQSLFNPPKAYIIIKQYLDQQLQQEMVICLYCRQDLQKSLAPQAITIHQRETQSQACLLCGINRQEFSQYVEYCYCEGETMVNDLYPFLVCASCLEEIYNNLPPAAQALRKEYYSRRFLTEC